MKAASMVVSPLADGSGWREPASQHSMTVSPVSRPASRPAAIEIPELSPGGTPGTPGAERTTRRNLRSSPYPSRGTSQPSTPNLSHTLDGMVIARSHSTTLDDFVLSNLPRSPLSGPSLAAARRHPPGYPSPSGPVAPVSASPAQRSGGASASSASPPRRRDASGGTPPPWRRATSEETLEGVQAAAAAAASIPASPPASVQQPSGAASAPLRAGAHRHHGGCGFMEDEVSSPPLPSYHP